MISRLPRRLGHALRDNRPAIAAVQWAFVGLYLVRLIVPALLPAGDTNTGALRRLGRFAEALFWGVWWPGVILSMMLIGQFWCGLLCPDGTLTEFVSRHGKGGKIPGWLRWPALPLAAFAVITVVEYALETHDTPRGTLLVLGTTTALALACGIFYGRGKRVWCRYACPVGGLFSLLARCAVLHFRVDREAWDTAPRPAPKPVDCPPLLDIRRLTSNEKCNMCGRCSGHRNAVELAWRNPGEEIATLPEDEARPWEAAGIVFVLIGLLYGALHWQQSLAPRTARPRPPRDTGRLRRRCAARTGARRRHGPAADCRERRQTPRRHPPGLRADSPRRLRALSRCARTCTADPA